MSRRAVFLALLALAASLGGFYARPAAEAALLLGEMTVAGDGLLAAMTPAPTRQAVPLGDLYLPGAAAEAGLVLVPGADRAGKDHPRVVALARSLARARFAVLVPDLPALRALEVSGADAGPIGEAAAWLERTQRPGRIGIAAVSYAVGPAILAALAEPKVAFVVAIGGYWDVTQAVTFFTTGHFRDRPDAAWQVRAPNAYGKWVFLNSNARRLTDSGDRVLLAAIAARRMTDAAAPIADLLPRLTPQGRAVMALLDNEDPERVPALIAALPQAVRADMAALDLSARDLSRLKARVLVVHGRDDTIIPWTEGAALARAVPRGELYLLGNLAHAYLKPGTVADGVTLWRMMFRLLSERSAPLPRAGE